MPGRRENEKNQTRRTFAWKIQKHSKRDICHGFYAASGRGGDRYSDFHELYKNFGF